MKVRELMCTNCKALFISQTYGDAAELFLKYHINGAPIVDEDNRVLNIITKSDLAKAYVEEIPMENTLDRVPQKKLITVRENTDIKDIWSLRVGSLPVLNNEGRLTGMLTHRDLSKKFMMEITEELSELKASQLTWKELDAIIESSYDGIYITDGEANTLKINKAYEEITGIKREYAIGKNMRELVEKKYMSQSATLIVLKERKATTILQEFLNGKKLMVSSNPVFDETGKITLVVTNVRDVTQLYDLENELEKNKKLTEKYYSEIEEMRMQLLGVSDMIAEDHKMLETMSMAKRVSKVDTTVLLLGETGVGKEEVAKYIHKNSQRSNKPFIKVNCGAIPANLIESELFGYEKGAFTGANKEGKMGLFELASTGTIFLDEIGELPLDMQVKLLRALQEGEIERVGGITPIKVDLRVIAATNRDLDEMVKEKLFREDLYYRLNVVPIMIPPLRERKGDILPLITYYLSRLNNKYHLNKSFRSEVLDILYEYNWPGNVRELKNIIERVVIMSQQDKISKEELPQNLETAEKKQHQVLQDDNLSLKEALETVEKDMIEKAFKKYGNVRSAAKALGIDASTFVRKRQKYEL